jgi:hypothetical protein
MVTAEELVQINNGEQKGLVVRLATVTELFENGTAKIKFYGEETASEKEYSYLASYRPKKDDVVVLLPILDTYIIADKIKYKGEESGGGYVTLDELQTILSNYVSTALVSYATKSELNGYLPIDGNGVFYVSNTSYFSTIGALKVLGQLYHTGGALGFFGSTPSTKRYLSTVSTSSSTTMTQCLGYINNIVEVLKAYGLC